jgi:hypothetical protein
MQSAKATQSLRLNSAMKVAWDSPVLEARRGLQKARGMRPIQLLKVILLLLAAFVPTAWSLAQSSDGEESLPNTSFFDHGFFAEAGYFVIPKRIEINSRMSNVFGPFGDGQEYSGGVNWFINGTHNWKLAVDLSKLNNTPANNSGPNLRAGDEGWLFRTQLQVAF